MSQTDTLQKYELFIHTTAEQLWQAITDGTITPKYFFGSIVSVELQTGGAIAYHFADGRLSVDGVVEKATAPVELCNTWRIHYTPDCVGETSRVTWKIEPRGALCKLTVLHELDQAPATARSVGNDGWSMVLSGLKTLLETGAPLPSQR